MKGDNSIKALISVAKINSGLTDDDIAQCIGKTRESVSRLNNTAPASWKLGTLKKYKTILCIDSDEVCRAIKEYLEC